MHAEQEDLETVMDAANASIASRKEEMERRRAEQVVMSGYRQRSSIFLRSIFASNRLTLLGEEHLLARWENHVKNDCLRSCWPDLRPVGEGREGLAAPTDEMMASHKRDWLDWAAQAAEGRQRMVAKRLGLVREEAPEGSSASLSIEGAPQSEPVCGDNHVTFDNNHG
ncbi:hypothetical protein K3495_g15312 [Podosphaera aphanis]|nr:hypothetical protein K3495_g15312 [Podosphaera aphanis]